MFPWPPGNRHAGGVTSDPAGLYTAALTLTNERRYREAEAALDAAASGADDNLRALSLIHI